jgi:sigma-B regulation protein RsbU (phosphoserine phosphatase)
VKLLPKILLILFMVTAGLMGTYTVLEVRWAKSQFEADAKKANVSIVSLISPTLAVMVWDVDADNAKLTLQSLFDVGDVERAEIFDEKGESFQGLEWSKSKEGKPELIALQKPLHLKEVSQEFREKTPLVTSEESLAGKIVYLELSAYSKRIIVPLWRLTKITKDDSIQMTRDFVGHLSVDFSTKFIQQRGESITERTIFWAVLLSASILAMTFFFIRKVVLIPVSSLTRASQAMATGSFERAPLLNSSDEIAELTKNFNVMVQKTEVNMTNLRLLEQEGRTISNSKSFIELEFAVSQAFDRIAGKELSLQILFHSSVLHKAHVIGYYAVREKGVPVFQSVSLPDHENFSIPQNILEIEHPQTHGLTIAAILCTKEVFLSLPQEVAVTLKALCVSIAGTIENIHFLQGQHELGRMSSELETARLVQKNLLPKIPSMKFGPYEISSYFRPAAECGGDWWNYFPLPDGTLLLLLGDVTGHGTPSALLTAVIHGYCESIHLRKDLDPRALLQELSVLVKSSTQGDRLMTMFVIIVDPIREEIHYSNAAHNFPFVLRQGTEGDLHSQRLMLSGSRLGFEGKKNAYGTFKIKTEKFLPGEMLLIFSDGLVERTNHEGQEYSEMRVKQTLLKHAEKSAEEINRIIIEDHEKFCDGYPQEDDITYIVLKYQNREFLIQNDSPHSEMFYFFNEQLAKKISKVS